jgi:glycosyltransferase involved in cell wall biosynthesis
LISIILFSFSANPNILNGLTGILALEQQQRGRLIAILVFSNIFLWFLSVYERGKRYEQKNQLDQLFRILPANEWDQIVNIEDKIKKIMIMIPAYNEEENLKLLLKNIPEEICGEEVGVLIVDDGSSDKTREVALKHGVLIIGNLINRGQGAASRLGYDVLLENGAKIIVTMDADNQHDPTDIQVLVKPILFDELDLSIGSRVLGSAETAASSRTFGIWFLSKVISFVIGIKITDCSSGFKAFNSNKMRQIRLLEDQFQASEVIIEAAKKGLRIGEVPVTIKARKVGDSKKGSNLGYGFRFLKTLISTWLR